MTKQSEIEKERMQEMFDNLGADKYPLKEYKNIGKKLPRKLDGPPKASGEAVYTMDIQLPGMLYMRFLTSPHPHAKILKMDTSKAEKLPGVRYVLRYDDPEMPEAANIGQMAGFFGTDKPLPGVAHFEGELVGAAVAADTEAIAEEALSLIEIDWEERPFNLDVEKAAEPDAPLSFPERYADANHWNKGVIDTLIKGDVKKGFAEADKIVEFRIVRRLHTGMGPERQCGVFKWNGDCPEVWLKQQRAHLPKYQISGWYGGVPMDKIQLHMPYQGGSFGGWTCVESLMGPHYCAGLVAKRTRRPVKYILTRREDFNVGSMDAGTYLIKVGFKNDGTITAVDGVLYNLNAYMPIFFPALHIHENTRVLNMNSQVKAVWINKCETVPTRCELLPPCLSFTMIMDRVAAELGMDPIEVALKNDGCEGHDMDWVNEEKKRRGFEVRDSLKECIDKGKAEFKWDESWHKPGARKLPNGRMHGVGFTWTQEWGDSLGSGEVAIRIERKDGTATILSMGCDQGVNAEETYCQIVADELGFRLEDVHYNQQVDPGFYRMTPGSSTNMSINGWAVRHAARILKQRILETVTSPTSVTQRGSFQPMFPDTRPEDLDIQNSLIFNKADPSIQMPVSDVPKRGSLAGSFSEAEAFGVRNSWVKPLFADAYHVQHGGVNPNSPRPRICRQAHFMEVEVDTETGEVFVTRVVNVNDVGKAINPMSCWGQQYGGSIMGVSRGKLEEMIHDPVTGVMLNGNLLDYKIATIKDIGPISTILVETGMGYGPYGLVGIGEDIATVLPGLLAPAVYNATGVWIEDFPITPDKVLKALGKI
ncbi:MAG: xanthine dehydrogenase family protein molybdopterin-binding subunit [Dehalococcoidia bacterium]|nr:xanthine dehydrogenase family protein molybdopterin-binding subunit [Dehalococcoidia bacterium]